MSRIPQRVNQFLWGKDENVFKEGVSMTTPCISFKSMQWIRFFMILGLIIVWGINFYVNVKKCLMYLNFWALTCTLLYMLFIFPSAGHQVIEKQLINKKQLEMQDQSSAWKRGVFLHTLAWPLSITSATLFSAFLWHDQLCSTFLDFGFSKWRRDVVFLASYFPLIVLLIDSLMNRLVVSVRHMIPNLIILGFYFLLALIGSEIQNRPIYANHLAFKEHYGNDYNYDKWNFKLGSWEQETLDECRSYFKWERFPIGSDEFNVIDWKSALFTTLGTGFATLIVSHLVLVVLSAMLKSDRKNRKESTADRSGDNEYKKIQDQ